jgi:hypothetical protein
MVRFCFCDRIERFLTHVFGTHPQALGLAFLSDNFPQAPLLQQVVSEPSPNSHNTTNRSQRKKHQVFPRIMTPRPPLQLSALHDSLLPTARFIPTILLFKFHVPSKPRDRAKILLNSLSTNP